MTHKLHGIVPCTLFGLGDSCSGETNLEEAPPGPFPVEPRAGGRKHLALRALVQAMALAVGFRAIPGMDGGMDAMGVYQK